MWHDGYDFVMATQPRISAVVLAWQAEPLLRRSVEALLASVGVQVEVVLVDNGCTTHDVTMLRRRDHVVVVGNGTNRGFAEGCNAGAAVSAGEYIALINADAVVEPTALARLAAELETAHVGIACGTLLLLSEPTLLNTRGNDVHFLGMSWCGGFRQKDTRTQSTEIAGASGAFMMMRREHWARLGGFDARYFAYFEDTEVSIRTWRMGLRVISVPGAIAWHNYESKPSGFKNYLLERNRIMFVATLWGGRALVLLGPPLILLEFAILFFALKEGWLTEKVSGYGWLWKNRRHLRARRRTFRLEGKIRDREWMRLLTDRFETPLINPPGIRIINAALSAYWALIRRWV